MRRHRKLLARGAELHVFEALPHGRFCGCSPEHLELIAAVERFEQLHLQS